MIVYRSGRVIENQAVDVVVKGIAGMVKNHVRSQSIICYANNLFRSEPKKTGKWATGLTL